MTIPACNDSAPSFASIAYVIGRARELARPMRTGRLDASAALARRGRRPVLSDPSLNQ